MPFLAPIIPAIAAGAASSAVGAGINAISKGVNGGSPQSAPLQLPTTTSQAQNAAQGVTGALSQQQQLANALGQQNGIGNQSSVYGQEQGLANQIQGIANGTGPNPALAQLANTTGQNVATQSALQAGQRGAGANAGLIARQAGQQGAATQQNAVGQAAALESQQQLNAINALQNQQSNLANLSTTQVGQQANAIGNLNQYQQGNQGQVLNAIQGQNSTLAGQQGGINSVNAGLASQANTLSNGLGAGVANGIGTALGVNGANTTPPTPQGSGAVPPLAAANGGLLFADGGAVPNLKENYSGKGPRSRLGQYLFAHGGKAHKEVDALVSPGEIYLPPSKVDKVAKGKASPLSGEKIPGKPKVGGAKNSYANDTVPKKLEVGGLVLPRSVTQAKHPAWAAHKFVTETLKKSGK